MFGAALKRCCICLVSLSLLALQPCFCEVVLTDSEASEIMTALTNAESELENAKAELTALKEALERQRQYYEVQLRGEERRRHRQLLAIGATSVAVIGVVVVAVVALPRIQTSQYLLQ